MAYCVNCGQQLAEGARFCQSCGKAITLPADPAQSGSAHNCPNCGGRLDLFTARCPACGFELGGRQAAGSVKQFYNDITAENEPDRKETLIRSFPVPNAREDILEFMILAGANFSAKDYLSGAQKEKGLAEAWLAKMEQSYHKAGLFFKNDAEFERIREIYETAKNGIAQAAKQKRIIAGRKLALRNAAFCAAVLLLLPAVLFEAKTGIMLIARITGCVVMIISAMKLKNNDGAVLADFVFGAGCCLAAILFSVFSGHPFLYACGGCIALIIVAVGYFDWRD